MADSLQLRIQRIEPLTSRVSAFTLVAADGQRLPAAQAGAHLEVEVEIAPGRVAHRAYSLVLPLMHVNASADSAQPGHYEIAVQREDEGAGGSRFMHRLREGDVLRARPPVNHFGLSAEATRHVLVAGGIGITPILAMAHTLARAAAANPAASFELHYAARSPEAMAYREQVRALPGATLYFDNGDPARGVPLPQVLAEPAPDRHLYVCGPKGLIEAAVRTAGQCGWSEANVHYELFAGALAQQGDAAFEVECARSGRVFAVPADKSILDVLLEQGFDPLFDCRAGHCGVCVTGVAQGVPEHRDSTLNAAERSAGRQICICVSRSRTPRLVLEL